MKQPNRWTIALAAMLTLATFWASDLRAQESLLELATKATEKKEYEKAAQIYLKILAKGGNPGIINYNLGNLYYRMGKIVKSIEAYEKVIAFAPNFKPSYLNLGKIYYQHGEYPKALNTFQIVLDRDPTNTHVLMLMGDTAKKLSLTVDAEKFYQEALALEPGKMEAYGALASLYFEVEDAQQALLFIDKGLAQKPGTLSLLELKARTLKNMKQYDRAAGIYEQVITDFKDLSKDDHYWFGYQMAYCLHEGKKTNLAIFKLKEFINLHPKKPEALNYLMSILLASDSDYEAVKFLKDLYPKNKPRAYFYMKDILVRAYNRNNRVIMRRVMNFYEEKGIRDQLYYTIKNEEN